MNIINLILNVIIFGFLFYWSTKIYKKQQVKPSIWKIILTLIVGLFSFSIILPFFNMNFKIAILPLGVWILYVLLKMAGSWEKYRSYAWLGFVANYFFLLSTLLTMVISLFIYPKDSIKTYISTISEARLIGVHPSAEDNFILVENRKEQLDHFKSDTFYDIDWYYEMKSKIQANNYNEQFPYLLVNSKSSWGSGLDVIVYIERDGKGILIKKGEETIYFRSNQSLLVEENK